MICFADTSFLCALYREQDNSSKADAFIAQHSASITVSSLVVWEFRQSTRFQVFRFSKDRAQGFSKAEAERMLAALDANLRTGAIIVKEVEWPDVQSLAERLSAGHTMVRGNRALDILHLATAIHLGIGQFLTFDLRQKSLAEAEQITVPL